MNRKFFSALLLMTLSVSSVGTLVSCKDYDDDISSVRNDVTSLRSDLEDAKTDLQNQLDQAKGDFAAQIQDAVSGKADQSAIDDLQIKLTAAETNLQTQIDAVNEALDNLDSGKLAEAEATLASVTGRVDNVENGLADVEKNLQLQQDVLDAFTEAIKNAGYQNSTELVEAVKTAQDAIAAIQSSVSSNSGDIKALKAQMQNAEDALSKLNTTVSGLQAQIDALKVYIDKILSSLVFAPDFYYGGIEAMEATTIIYDPVLLKNDSPASNPTATGETWTPGEETSLTPDITARYHMNPSYFDVTKIKSMSVVSDDKEYIELGDTRTAASAPSVVKDSWLKSKDGMLNVTLNLDASKIADAKDKVTVLAVQAHFNDAEGKDTTVTSDYAAVAKSTISKIKIADTDKDLTLTTACTSDPKLFHIYTTAQEAISNDPTHEIVYNDPEGVDLTKLVQMHFTRNSNSNETATDDVSKYGMKWQFAESHYTAGTNNTSESAHIYLSNNHAIACTVDDNGNPQKGQQGRSSLNRKPMVRVELVDTVHNNIVAVGFIKFNIVEKAAEPADDININFTDKGYNLSCDEYTFTQTWAQVEAKVLSELNMSKEEFEQKYSVEKIGATDNCQLYGHNEAGEIVKTTNYGTITELENTGSHETTVLKWTVGSDAIYGVVWDATKGAYKTGVSLESGVKFAPKDGDKTKPNVYVWFNTGTISTPTASLTDANKIKENWAATNGKMGSGYAEIHNNVEVVGQVDAQDRFSQDILATFVGNKINLTLSESNSDAFQADNLSYTFKFIVNKKYETQTGQSGKKYTMSVGDEGSTLYATDATGTMEEVAKLSNSSDGVTSAQSTNSVVQYQKTDFAKDLLNAASHNDLANTVTATVGVYAANKNCDMQLPIANNTFDIKFLRPLDVKGGKGIIFTDAIDGGNKANMASLVEWSDWRDQWKENYISYYGVTEIKAETDDITTTLNGGTLGKTLLDPVTSKVKFYYHSTGATDADGKSVLYDGKDFGYLLYENNNSVTGEFQIRVPLTITYDWGEITTSYVDITVQSTKAQEARAKVATAVRR